MRPHHLACLTFALLSLGLTSVEPQRAQDVDFEVALTRLLRRFDDNRDRRISPEEFPGPARRFQRLDRDGNGFLDRADAPEAEPEAPATPVVVGDEEASRFFEERIRPVLVESCYRCHSTEGDRIRGGLVLDSRETLMIGGSSGPAVIPGNPDASLLVIAMRYTDEELEMPPKSPLTADVVSDFERWVEMGAPWPGHENAGEPAPYQSSIDIEAGRSYWAFQVPTIPKTPDVKDEKWAWSDLDRFLLAEMEERGLRPVEDADDREWLRRVSLDLSGLPPTTEDIASFLDDSSKERYETVVDRLLESPQFGERWGRHWLDVARYAESAGRDSNYMYPHAWRYRDYVIEAFDRDVPYNQFLVEQIAGDLLPAEDATERARLDVATGLLAIGSKGHNTRDPRQFAADLADEQINTVSQGALGLTISCARCHDHKFDPIAASDYYALAGIFRSSETLYGTYPAIRNRHATELLPLPEDAQVSSGAPMEPILMRFAREQQQRLESEVAALGTPERRGRGARREEGMDMGDAQASRARQRILRDSLETVSELLSRFDADGNPTSANRVAMGMRDGRPLDAALLVRGEVEAEGPRIPRGAPAVLSANGIEIPEGSSGRLELARWIASEENPLTARVWVNRVWLHLFGQGIVSTPDNFGASGQAPSHPELLDYLAATFVAEDDWSTKALVRRVVLSRAYHLSTASHARNERVDPEAIYLWHMPDRRLDAEAIRDSMLFAAGTLDLERPVGSMINSLEGQPRRDRYIEFLQRPSSVRSVYLPILRDHVPDALEVFDAADPSFVTGDRQETSVATQALFLMNDEEVLAAADDLARRIQAEAKSEKARIELAFELTLGREPSSAERRAVSVFLKDYAKLPVQEEADDRAGGRRDRRSRGRYESPPSAESEAWSAFAQTLFLSVEFRYAG